MRGALTAGIAILGVGTLGWNASRYLPYVSDDHVRAIRFTHFL